MRLLLVLLLILISGCNEKERKAPKTVVLAFHAEWCNPCKAMIPIEDQLIAEGCKIKRIDVDQNPELSQKFNVQSLPTFIVTKGDKEVSRVVGQISKANLKRLCRKA